MTDWFSKWAQAIYVNEVKLTEEQLMLRIQPKPAWLPEWAWRKVIARVVVLEKKKVI